jgi:hypothetical protein
VAVQTVPAVDRGPEVEIRLAAGKDVVVCFHGPNIARFRKVPNFPVPLARAGQKPPEKGRFRAGERAGLAG